jgi:hypothetical protein
MSIASACSQMKCGRFPGLSNLNSIHFQAVYQLPGQAFARKGQFPATKLSSFLRRRAANSRCWCVNLLLRFLPVRLTCLDEIVTLLRQESSLPKDKRLWILFLPNASSWRASRYRTLVRPSLAVLALPGLCL